jgi:hypothetical protein
MMTRRMMRTKRIKTTTTKPPVMTSQLLLHPCLWQFDRGPGKKRLDPVIPTQQNLKNVCPRFRIIRLGFLLCDYYLFANRSFSLWRFYIVSRAISTRCMDSYAEKKCPCQLHGPPKKVLVCMEHETVVVVHWIMNGSRISGCPP